MTKNNTGRDGELREAILKKVADITDIHGGWLYQGVLATTDEIMKLITTHTNKALDELLKELGLDVESFGDIPAERVQKIINSKKEKV